MNLSFALHKWVIALGTIIISLCGVVLALICIYSLPDRVSRPFFGVLFYLFSSFILIFYFFLMWKQNKVIENNLNKKMIGQNYSFVLRESLSDKILKWFIASFAMFFAIASIAISILCIFSLPDKNIKFIIGIQYFTCGFMVLGILVYVVWKNWVTTKLSKEC